MNDHEAAPADGVWARHRDSALYTSALIGLVVCGLLWKGALSLILSPLWMLAAVWIAPSAIERLVGYRR